MKFTLKGFDTVTEPVRIAVLEVGVPNALGVVGARGEQLVKQNISSPFEGRPPAVATGNLVNSVQFKQFTDVNLHRVVVFVGAPSDTYADAVETGSRPHFPPPNALLLWVKRKFAVSTEKQALSIAFAIARNIAKRGVRAFAMFARASAVLEGELLGIFEVQIANALQAAGLGKK